MNNAIEACPGNVRVTITCRQPENPVMTLIENKHMQVAGRVKRFRPLFFVRLQKTTHSHSYSLIITATKWMEESEDWKGVECRCCSERRYRKATPKETERINRAEEHGMKMVPNDCYILFLLQLYVFLSTSRRNGCLNYRKVVRGPRSHEFCLATAFVCHCSSFTPITTHRNGNKAAVFANT